MHQETTSSDGVSLHRSGRRFSVVLNEASGSRCGGSGLTETVQAAFTHHGLIPVFIPASIGNLAARMLQARESGTEGVVVVGGDGTVACAAQVLVGTDIPLGILPTGTMNRLARDLGIPIHDIASAVGLLAHARTRRIDVGEVNGHIFVCASSIGLLARMARYREAGRGRPTLRMWVSLVSGLFRMILRFRPPRLTLLIEGKSRSMRTPSVTVSVNLFSDGTGRQLGRAHLDGGVLGVCVFTRLRLADAFRVGIATLLGHWRRDPAIEELHVEAVTISARTAMLPVMNDGEVVSIETPLRYRVRGKALALFAPHTACVLPS